MTRTRGPSVIPGQRNGKKPPPLPADIPAERTSCGYCGARSDIGCSHSRAHARDRAIYFASAGAHPGGSIPSFFGQGASSSGY